MSTNIVAQDCEINQEIPIVFGRPVLTTGRKIIDTDQGEMKFCVQNNEVSLRFRKTKKQLMELQEVSIIDVVEKEMEDEFLKNSTWKMKNVVPQY